MDAIFGEVDAVQAGEEARNKIEATSPTVQKVNLVEKGQSDVGLKTEYLV